MIGGLIAARDEVFRQSGLDVTYLRASGLMSNATWWANSIRDEGRAAAAVEVADGHLDVLVNNGG